MIIDFRKPILDFSGEPTIWKPEVLDKKTGDVLKPAVILTVLVACQESLGASYPDEQTTLSQATKVERFTLAMKIGGPIPVEITSEESGEILRLVSKCFPGSLVYPRVSEIFNVATKSAKTKQEAKAGG
jgi:hypothetical protein